MKYTSLFSLAVAAFMFSSCGSEEKEETTTTTTTTEQTAPSPAGAPTGQPAPAATGDANLQTAPPPAMQQAPPAQTTAPGFSGKPNPAHGEPGHRCDMQVGAILP